MTRRLRLRDVVLVGVLGVAAGAETVATIVRAFVDSLPTTILSVATLVTSIAAWQASKRAAEKAERVQAHVQAVATAVEVVRTDVNSKMQQLVETTRVGAAAAGELKGRDDERAASARERPPGPPAGP